MESDLSSDDEVTTIGAGDSDVEQINSGGDWRLPIKETDVNRRFFIEFIDGRKTTRRKCRDCFKPRYTAIQGRCTGEERIFHLGERLKIFGLELSGMDYMVTDCGSDVQKVAQDELIENFDDFADEDDFEFITDSRYRLNYSDIILKVRSTVKDILSKPTLCDRLKAAQNIQGNTPLKLVAENATRWNSLFDMLERFVSLRNSVELIVDLHDFDWAKVSELINLLKPLKECTMDLQDSKANVKTAVSILKFLRQKSLSNDLLGKAIKTVWDKWIRPNQVADALLHGDGTFYDYIRRKKVPVVEDTEHSYGADASSSYKTFKDQCQNSSEFDIIDALDGFIPANVDAERLFSWGRLSKNYLQCQMSADNHSRNVFLNKCQHLI